MAHTAELKALTKICKEHEILVSGVTTLGPLFHSPDGPIDETVKAIAKARGISDTQVLLMWAAQKLDGPVAT